MNDFLKSLGLEERIYYSVPETIDLSAPSYDGVDEKLEIKRQESLAFLRENLEAAYREKWKGKTTECRKNGSKRLTR